MALAAGPDGGITIDGRRPCRDHPPGRPSHRAGAEQSRHGSLPSRGPPSSVPHHARQPTTQAISEHAGQQRVASTSADLRATEFRIAESALSSDRELAVRGPCLLSIR